MAPTGSSTTQSDGVTTLDPTPAEGVPFYPGLPPNSGDLVYDSGDYAGQSRNLQNAGINPGWSYWGHQVRFTPAANMQGELLEVRYVATTQWGATKDFDLVLRDASGAVISSMPGLTAVTDSGNWQVIDVSSLDFVPSAHGSDFYVEMQPSSQCGGTNGFTIAYSTIGSGRSSFSSDCTNPFGSYITEGRDLFIRAVVELGPPTAPGTAYCFGDGSGASCPCFAAGSTGHGCPNTNPNGAGALLTATGTALFANDTFGLSITDGAFNKAGIIIQGASAIAYPNGDGTVPNASGIFCVSPNLRGDVFFTDGTGAAMATDFQSQPFGASALPLGSTTYYQYWYRDPGNSCQNPPGTDAAFNFSNAWEVDWQ